MVLEVGVFPVVQGRKVGFQIELRVERVDAGLSLYTASERHSAPATAARACAFGHGAAPRPGGGYRK